MKKTFDLRPGDRLHVRVELKDRPIRDYVVVVSEDGLATIEPAPAPAPPVQTPNPISDPSHT